MRGVTVATEREEDIRYKNGLKEKRKDGVASGKGEVSRYKNGLKEKGT
jgi:hypothetical protein